MHAAQHTLAQSVTLQGIGLHSGENVVLKLSPAAENTGIVFERSDLSPTVTLPARSEYVGDTTLCTGLLKEGVKVATIEHLMSAFAALAIDNVRVEVSGAEIPILDGSAAPFVYLLQQAGRKAQAAPRRFLKIVAPVVVTQAEKSAQLEPYEGQGFDFHIDFNHRLFAHLPKDFSFELECDAYISQIARARTFGFLSDIERLHAQGLARGGGLDNAVVIGEERVLNREGLRFEDEFVRHKLLDAIGDLYLAGAPIWGRYVGNKSGHALNHQLLCALKAKPEAWRWID